jgi:MoaA/NifB/PqqE/SkfB family radical SAM enzyme
MRVTPKRLLNYHVVRYQHARGHVRLRGYPLTLTLEATNVCNLGCPACFTGAGEVGRKQAAMPMPLFQKIMDELGDYALNLEFYNWGEPLLSKHLPAMIRIASQKGISTIVSTNFSIPFDRAKAEALVSSGLALLACSIDGATQAGYEQYRVGGKLELVLRNVRLITAAKQALGSDTPRLIWSYRIFEHNLHEIEPARALARELGMEFAAAKGWVEGPEWNDGGKFGFPVGLSPARCHYLWTQAIIQNDGRVSPCCCSFYQEDDYGSLEGLTFRDVWNNDEFRAARRLYRGGNHGEDARRLICHDCPQTVVWNNYRRHRSQGLSPTTFDPGYSANDWFNFFFNRRRAVGMSRKSAP